MLINGSKRPFRRLFFEFKKIQKETKHRFECEKKIVKIDEEGDNNRNNDVYDHEKCFNPKCEKFRFKMDFSVNVQIMIRLNKREKRKGY